MASHCPSLLLTSHIGTNTPKFLPPRWGRPPFDPTQTGLCKFGCLELTDYGKGFRDFFFIKKPRSHPNTLRDESILGKSKGGLTKGGLSPEFSEKIGGKSFLRNRAFSGQIGTFSGPIGAFSGPIRTNSSAPHSHGGRAEIAPKGPFLAHLAPFGPSPLC